MVHEVDELGIYCGPAALIAVTGKRLPEVRSAINKVRGKRHNLGICGLSRKHLIQTLSEFGFKYSITLDTHLPKECRTLEKLIGSHNYCLPFFKHIVNVTGHYVTVEDGIVIDNHTRFGCPVSEHWCAKKKVKAVITILD